MHKDTLKVTHVTNNYTPFKGGVVQAIKAIVEQQQKEAIDCTIVSLEFLDHTHEDPVHVKRVPTFFKRIYHENQIAIPRTQKKYFKKLFSHTPPSLVHLHHPFLLGNAALKVACQQHIPTVFTFHTLYEEYVHYLPFPKWMTRPITRSLVTTFCNKVDSILVPNNTIKKYVESRSVDTPITIIPNPIRNDILPVGAPVIRSRPHCPLRLLVVSRFVPEKNIETIITMVHLLAMSVELIIAGYGYWLDTLRAYTKKCMHSDTLVITFCVNPSREQLRDLYAWADLFLFASKTDTQAVVLAEAMAHATPVIALKGPAQQDVIINYKNGFLVDSVTDMVAAIYYIATHHELFITLQHGAIRTSNEYTMKVVVDKLTNHYYHVIDTFKPHTWYNLLLKKIT